MRTALTAIILAATWSLPLNASGLMVPSEGGMGPLTLVNQRVSISIEDQAAITKIEQTFRNESDRQLEAIYIFPIPKGASVNHFTMSVNGKEMSGELLKADDANRVYTDIVRRTRDPGLLEYVGNNVMRLKVFPILPNVDQKVSVSYNQVLDSDGGIVEYTFPMKTDCRASRTLKDLSINATIKPQHRVQSVYSPSHSVAVRRISDNESQLSFELNQALLDKDFQFFYMTGDKDIGLTPMFYRPLTSEPGYFMMQISPNMEISKDNVLPRDVVLVLDTSGSMDGIKMDQARKALRFCLGHLNPQDRFGLMNFSTTVTRYRDELLPATSERIDDAKKWVNELKAVGGTAIEDALNSALDMRSKDESRTFTIVFFTDGEPTVGETNPDRIVANVAKRNTANTRIFTFGVGDDVNAAFLDQLANQSRAVSTYVRQEEDIEVKVSSLYTKVSHPVLTNLKLTTGENVHLEQVYPPSLPDLFHGGNVIVLGRYTGTGAAAIRLSGTMGKDNKEFVYETKFPEKTNDDKEFVEQIWARRKVGYLLDQMRAHGQNSELMHELLVLAKRYGIVTPFTSQIIVPDGQMQGLPTPRNPYGLPAVRGNPMTSYPANPNVNGNGISGGGSIGGGGGGISGGISGGGMGGRTGPGRGMGGAGGGFGGGGGSFDPNRQDKANQPQSNNPKPSKGDQAGEKEKGKAASKDGSQARADADKSPLEMKKAYDSGKDSQAQPDLRGATGQAGVDLSIALNALRNQDKLGATAKKSCNGRNCLELGSWWIDEEFNENIKVVKIKAQSDAYFRILSKQPKMSEVFRLGNRVIWISPSKIAIMIDTEGKESLDDKEIDDLFAAAK